jgi:hypothetical protein
MLMSSSENEETSVVMVNNSSASRGEQQSWRCARRLLISLTTLALVSAASPLTAEVKAVVLDPVEMRLATLPEGTAGMMAEYVPEGDGRVYLLGGYRTGDSSGTLELSRDVWVYDPLLDELSSFGSLPIGLALAAHAYVPEENAIYLFGGLEEVGGSVAESDAVRVWNVETGELTTLSATLSPARSRPAAAYVPDLNRIFLFGGVTGEAAVSPYESSIQDQIEVFDVSTGELRTVGSAPGWYLDAHLVASSYPAVPTPEPPDDTTIRANSFIYLAGPDGYALFNPHDETFLTDQGSLEINGLLGAASVYVPRLQRIWSAGGYGARTFLNQCWQDVIVAFDPTSLDDSGAGYSSVGTVPLETGGAPVLGNTQTDGSAVHVPDLDRVFVFGGFRAPQGETCVEPGAPEQLWPSLPGASTYSTGIYSVTPTYTSAPGSDASPLVPTRIDGSVIKGGSITVTVRRADPPFKLSPPGPSSSMSTAKARDESFVLALQAAYDIPGRPPEIDMRFLANIDGSSPSETIDVADVVIPEDISSGPGQRDQQVVAVCVLSLDRPSLPPNCREVAVTLDPGTIRGTITRDRAGLGQPGVIEPVEGALVELFDQTRDLVASDTTDASGNYSLCEAENCLAIGRYTVNVSKSYSSVGPESGFVHLPTSVATEVFGGTETVQDVTLQVTEAVGPIVKTLRSEHNALTGDEIGTFLAFDHLRGKPGMPDIPSVLNLFTVNLEQTVSQPSRVVFELNGTPYEASGGSNSWSLLLDMSQVLVAGDNILRVTAYDSSAPTPLSTFREFTIKAVAAKPVSGTVKSYVDLDSITWDPARQRYTTRVIVPKDLRWPDDPDVLDLILIKLYSQARARVELLEYYRLDGNWEADSNADIALKILSTDPTECDFGSSGCMLEKRFPVTAVLKGDPEEGEPTRIESYQMRSPRFDLCKLGLPKCREWIELYKYPCDPDERGITPQRKLQCEAQQTSATRGFSASAAGFSASITLKLELTLSAQYSATLLVQGTLSGDDWRLDEVRVIPTPHFGLQAKGQGTARGEVKAPAFVPDFSFSISAGIIAEAHLFWDQPIVYDPDRSSPIYLDDPCVNFLARAQAFMDLPSPIPDLKTKWWKIAEQDLPDGCFESRDLFPGEKSHLPDPEPPSVMPNPVVAVSQFGDKAVFVWVEEMEASPGLTESHLFFEAEGPLGTTSGTVPTGGRVVDPALAFVNNDEALAVWSELAPLTEATSVPELLRTQEVYAAMWNVDTGWGDPVQLSSNSMADGRPVIAGDPNTGIDGQAIVAWVRDPDADPETAGDLQIVARHWDGTTWGAERLVADEPGTADADPALAFARNGTGRAWMVWVRDHDAVFATNEDRFLNYSVWNGASWSAATEPTEWPAGALSPGLVFSPRPGLSERPLVTMVARGDLGTAPDGADLGSAGIGFEGRLYAAWWGGEDDGWDVQAVADTRAEKPRALLASDDRALIVLRGFGGGNPDDPPRLGSVAVAAGELNPDGARWMTPGQITTGDDQVFWLVSGISIPLESAGDADFPFRMVGVQENLDGRQSGAKARALQRGAPAPVALAKNVTAKILGGTDQTGVMEFGARTDGIDIELEELTVDNEQPEPGEVVKVFVQIRNTTVRPLTEALGAGPPEACLYVNGLYIPQDPRDPADGICSPRHQGELLFNERHTFELSYRSTGRPELVRVEVNNRGDLDRSNQEAEILVGSIPGPQDLTLALLELAGGDAGQVKASWRQPPVPGGGNTWSYRIYRGPAATGPWELLGFTLRESFIDAAPDEGELYYAVEAFDQLNRRSPKTVAELLALADDSDNDGVPDAEDVCPGFDDTLDSDEDGVPDGCDICPGYDDEPDADFDGVPDGCDRCDEFDDSIDTDDDGAPDECDVCQGFDDGVDSDGDGVPDGCDDRSTAPGRRTPAGRRTP